MSIPNLAGIATADLVEQIGGSGFKASYINWARTLHLLHVHAPGWLPELVPNNTGGIVHEAPVGAFLLIYFRHPEHGTTPPVPQAIMDTRNAAIPVPKITARDITDTHRRGTCMAAALTFGLAYELWAKMPLESGYASDGAGEPQEPAQHEGQPNSGVWDEIAPDRVKFIQKAYATAMEYLEQDDVQGAVEYKQRAGLEGPEEGAAFWSLFASYERSAMKMAHDGKHDDAVSHLQRNRAKARKAE